MGSSRLPGKVLQPINGQPMLTHVVQRVQQATLVDEVIVATSLAPEDDAIADWARGCDALLFRGSLHDVLDRVYQAARSQLADVVVRVTADCPLLDPQLVDRTIRALQGEISPRDEVVGRRVVPISHLPPTAFPFDLAANRLPPPWQRTYPIGLDVEVATFAALEAAWENADQAYEREHVMPYLYQRDGVANVVLLHAEADYSAHRWTVDTPEDLDFVRQLFARLGDDSTFTWRDVLRIVQDEPSLQVINAHVPHKTVFDVDSRRP